MFLRLAASGDVLSTKEGNEIVTLLELFAETTRPHYNRITVIEAEFRSGAVKGRL